MDSVAPVLNENVDQRKPNLETASALSSGEAKSTKQVLALPSRTSARFFDFARLKSQIDADADLPLKELHQRDSKLAESIDASSNVSRLLAWLDRIEASQSSEASKNQSDKFQHHQSFIILILVILGLVSGVVSMSGVLLANNQQPVNILVFIALFIWFQIALLLLTLASAFLPLTENKFSSPLLLFNPSALALKTSFRRNLALMPWDSIPHLSRLAVLRWGQILGISFNLSLLLSMFIILAVSDRSFGWSSTFTISGHGLKTFLDFLSSPWSWFYNNGGVSWELIEGTRFQALQTQFDSQQMLVMRQWWPFLFCSLVFYGLLPRIILFVIFHFILHSRLQNTFVQYPGAALILNRLNTAYVSTSRSEIKTLSEEKTASTSTQSLPTFVNFSLVNWVNACNDNNKDKIQALGLDTQAFIDAGQSLENDQQVIEQVNQTKSTGVVIAVKSWEPPLAELNDFLLAINNEIDCYLLLIPLGNRSVSTNEVSDWEHFAASSKRGRLQILHLENVKQSEEGP